VHELSLGSIKIPVQILHRRTVGALPSKHIRATVSSTFSSMTGIGSGSGITSCWFYGSTIIGGGLDVGILRTTTSVPDGIIIVSSMYSSFVSAFVIFKL
jgi:hypothetical protein